MRLGQFLTGYNTPPSPPEVQLADAMAQAGITPPASIHLDGALHRFSTCASHDDDAGWYVGYADNVPAGAFGNWRTGISSNWVANVGHQLSESELASVRIRQQAVQAEREKARASLQAAVSDVAEIIWSSTKEAGDDNAYLARKHVHAHGTRQTDDGRLVVPMFGPEGDMVSLQYIGGDGTKRYHSGGQAKGAFWTIGDASTDGDCFLCEGFATGASVNEATGKPVFIAFSAGNLGNVAMMIRKWNKTGRITIVADNDESGVGQKEAEAAASVVSCDVTLIPEVGMDANDYAVKYGDAKLAAFLTHKESWFDDGNDYLKQPAPLEWLINRWIQKGALVMIHGASGSGKTFVALDMLLSMSCGLPDWQGCEVMPAKVAYLCGEGNYGLRARISAWAQAHGVDGIGTFLISHGATDFDKPSGLSLVVGQLEDRGVVPDIVAVDTLNRFFSGDENSAQDARGFLASCGELQRRYGCTVLIVHHTGLNEDAQQRARGSSAWKAALDGEISVTKTGEGLMKIEQMKMKDSELEKPLTAHLEGIPINGWIDAYGKQVTSAVLVGDEELPVRRDESLDRWKKAVADAVLDVGQVDGGLCRVRELDLKYWLKGHGFTKEEVENAFRKEARRVMQKLIAEGWMERSEDGVVTVLDVATRMMLKEVKK